MSVLDLNVKQKFSFFFLFLKFFSYFIYFYFIYLLLFLAALGLCCCAWPFSSCGKRGLLFIAVCGLLSSWWLLLLQSTGSRHEGFGSCGTRAQQLWHTGSVIVAHGLSSCGSRALEHRLSSCGARAQLLRSMWDLPGPGLKPMSPALAGGFLTTATPGKSLLFLYKYVMHKVNQAFPSE